MTQSVGSGDATQYADEQGRPLTDDPKSPYASRGVSAVSRSCVLILSAVIAVTHAGAVSVAGAQGIEPGVSTILAVSTTVVLTYFLVSFLIIRPTRKSSADLDAYTARLARLDLIDRNMPLDGLRVEGDLPLSRLSEQVHRLLAESLARRAEAARLRRTMDQEIRRETSRATVELDRLAHFDQLTEIGNRRRLETLGPRLVDEAIRRNHELALVAIDIDLFKEINDTLGHAEGDRVLQHVGAVLRSILRESDEAFRLGGDEFVVMLRDANAPVVSEISDRIQKRFRQICWKAGEILPRPSLSMGVGLTSLCQGRPELESLMSIADEALYESKRNGRGRTTIAHRRQRAA